MTRCIRAAARNSRAFGSVNNELVNENSGCVYVGDLDWISDRQIPLIADVIHGCLSYASIGHCLWAQIKGLVEHGTHQTVSTPVLISRTTTFALAWKHLYRWHCIAVSYRDGVRLRFMLNFFWKKKRSLWFGRDLISANKLMICSLVCLCL